MFGKMRISAERYSKAAILTCNETEREGRLREMEGLLNNRLAGSATLSVFQEKLYAVIEELSSLGFFLGRWDYDSEIETWGGPSYMDPGKEDDLLLRSTFPSGVALAWKDFERLPKNA